MASYHQVFNIVLPKGVGEARVLVSDGIVIIHHSTSRTEAAPIQVTETRNCVVHEEVITITTSVLLSPANGLYLSRTLT